MKVDKVYIVVGQEKRGGDDNLAVFIDEKDAEVYADKVHGDCLYGARIEEHELR